MMSVTLAEVARRAGVSTGTASRVLNNKMVMPIPQHTVDRIHKAAREMSYTPNRHARALATRRTHTLGFCSEELTDPHGAVLLETVQAEAVRRGYHLVVSSHRESLTAAGHTDGLIAFRPPSEACETPRGRQPVLYVYPSRVPLLNTIGWSDYEAARSVAHTLASLGHRTVAGIYGAGAPDKQPGFAAGAGEAGLEIVELFETEEPLEYRTQAEYVEFFLESGYRLALRMLREHPRTTAVFARNDVLGAGVLHALRDAGVPVPGRMSVVSYNDTLVAACAAPPLTSVRTPIREAGRLAVERLIQAIERGEAGFPGRLLPTEFIVRGSTAQREGEGVGW